MRSHKSLFPLAATRYRPSIIHLLFCLLLIRNITSKSASKHQTPHLPICRLTEVVLPFSTVCLTANPRSVHNAWVLFFSCYFNRSPVSHRFLTRLRIFYVINVSGLDRETVLHRLFIGLDSPRKVAKLGYSRFV